MPRPTWTVEDLREAVARSSSYSGVLRTLGLRPAGGNHRNIRRWIQLLELDVTHFAPAPPPTREPRPLSEVFVARSTYPRGHLKERLYREGLKERRCELCGQGEEWRGRRMSLILDHINGVADDHRLENLRIVCPNCAATLDTHCGRNTARARPSVACALCGQPFQKRYPTHRFCSRACGTRAPRAPGSPGARRVERPPYDVLLARVRADGFSATGRRYGVSDNAIRKWLLGMERELAAAPPARGAADRAPTIPP